MLIYVNFVLHFAFKVERMLRNKAIVLLGIVLLTMVDNVCLLRYSQS